MNAWLWVANPALKWRETSGLTPFEALRRYLEARYVYWATPDFQRHIRVGDPAYIWLSENGIIAAGEVAEVPKSIGDDTGHFDRPDQLEAPGWNERNATSDRKTGISIEHLFLEGPLMVRDLFPPTPGAKTIVRLNENQHHRIMSAMLRQTRP
jgi:hypothetical protein